MFNSLTVFKREKRQNYNAYYSYLDELMNTANILMDGIIYNDRRSFAALISALHPVVKTLIFNDAFMNPDVFPFVDVMQLILFNRHLNNYDVKCIYDSDTYKKNSGELLPDMLTIIEENLDVFAPILEKGSVVVEFSYTFGGVPWLQVHFVVIRMSPDKTIFA